MTHAPHVRCDPLRSSPGWTDAPDVQFVREAALDEVNECPVGRPQGKVTVEPGRRSEDRLILRSPGCRLRRTSGSPGPGVWYASREPSCDQSNSATPSRYGLGSPPRVGTAQMPMSPPLEPSGLRTQKVTREPSGENPRVRIDGLASSRNTPVGQVVEHTRTDLGKPDVHLSVAVRQKRDEMAVA